MIDEYGRGIDYIRISVTDRCNLRCVYCMPKEGVNFLPHSEILTYEEIIRLCNCFAELGIRKIKITGGEPLVRKDLPSLIKRMKEIDGIENVTITTNGVLLAEQIDELVKSGVDSVNISLDTLDPEQFLSVTRFNLLDKVLEGIKAALKYPELTVKINCVPIKGKKEEEAILSMVSLAKDNRVHVRFIELMPIGLGKELSGYTEESIQKMIEENYGELTPYHKSLGNGPCTYYSLEGFRGRIGFISAMSHKFCDSCNRVRLTSDGYLKNCLQYSAGTGLKQLMVQGISDHELKEVIRASIKKKPKAHQFEEIKKIETENETDLEERKMSQIGG